MGALTDMIQAFQSVDVESAIEDAFRETEDAYADQNAAQMFEGLRSDETEITPDYTDLTIQIKEEKGQPTDRVTLKDTGAFYKGLYADLQGTTIIVASSDSKSEKLEEKYGKTIFTLDPDHKREYIFGPFLQALLPKLPTIQK